LLHQVLRLHPDLAWVTPWTNWICGKALFRAVPPQGARWGEHVLHRLPRPLVPPFLRGPYDGSLEAEGVFETHEGHSIWNRHCPAHPHHAQSASDVTDTARRDFRDVAQWHRAYHRRPRFVSKTPRNTFRLPFLHAIFPEAHVLHLVRDGRAVSASILKRRLADHGTLQQWWGAKPPGWQDLLAQPPIVQAHWTWTTCLDVVNADARRLPELALTTLRYEDFTCDPESVLRGLFKVVELDATAFFTPSTRRHLSKIRPPSEAWRDQLSDDQKTHLEAIRPWLATYGYR
jgi:hypothetical protein